ncbi:hypothetical protein [Salinactinospora qingdaonensis]|uniref:Uncharacterized protein n=1 Tax=Salinactinospora qingdaonensis TaxID=702744 RepID=A0ABP7GCP7_9ACTN
MNAPYPGPDPHYGNLPYGHAPPSHGDIHERLLATPFEAVAPHLRLVLFGGDATGLGGDKLAYSINPTLTAVLAYRLDPGSFQSALLEQRHAQAWAMNKRDLWFSALHNMAYDQYRIDTYPGAPDTASYVVTGLTWPASAHVMRLSDLIAEPMPYGAVAMAPEPNTLICAVLRSKRSAPVIPAMHLIFCDRIIDGVPLTDQLLWWRGGSVSGMPMRPSADGGVQVRQSPEFSYLLDYELPD